MYYIIVNNKEVIGVFNKVEKALKEAVEKEYGIYQIVSIEEIDREYKYIN